MSIKRLFLLPVLLLFLNYTPVLAAYNEAQVTSQPPRIELRALDRRAVILQAYLAKYNSPLQYHAQDFVDAADTYNLDWKLVPAIAGVESTFGKHVPGGHNPAFTSYNAWGWGVYGDQSLGFQSWKDGIFTVTGGLRNGYFNKGLTNPYTINKKYASSPTWGMHVSFFLADLNKFEANFNNKYGQLAFLEMNHLQSGPSAQIAR